MPVARPSEQCPNIDPRQPGMVERGTIPSRLDRDASNGSVQVSHIFTDVSGHQTEGPSPQAAEQRSTEAPESHTYESYPVPIGPPVPMRVSRPEIPGFASASTFVNTFADMAPYSSGDGGVQDNMDEKSEDLDLPSAVMGDLLQYESIGPLELENPQHSRFEFEPLPSWQDTSRRSLNTPIGSVRYDYYDPLSYYDPPTDSELPSAVMGDLVLYEHIGPLELENPQHSRYDYEPLPSWQHIDRLPTLTTINESELHQASASQSICPVEPLAVFDEEIIMRPEPSPEESEEDESEEDEPEALLSRTPPPTSQLNQNAIPPSKPPPLDISSPPPSSGDRIDHLPSLPMALGGDLGVEGSTADPDNSRGVANPPLSSNTDSAPQCTLSIAAFTDSGYGSTIGESRQAKVIPTPIHGSVTGDILQETASLTTNDPSMDDVQTVYSNCSSISNSKKDVYVSALAEELSSYVRSYKPDAGVLDQMYEALPGFLKMFALSLAHNREALVYRDIMAFVHKYRRDIVVALRNKLSDGPLVQRPSQDEDVMPLSEIINRWKSTTDEANEDVPDAVPELNSSRAMNTDGVIDLATIQTPSTDGPHYGSDIESNMESQNRPKPEEEAASKLPELVPYIQLICDSGAYTDLLANIQKACCLSSPQPNTMRRVRDVVLKVLPVKSFISRKRIPDSYSMIYTVGWDISAFVSQQGHDSAAETAIESSITLTGSPNELQALACSEYIAQTWPSIGPSVLLIVKKIAMWPRQEHDVVLPDDSTIKAFPCYTYDTHGIMVSGPSYTIAQVGEVLAWLGSTFRTSPYSKGVVYREPFALKSKNLPGYPGAYVCHLDYVELKEGNGSGSQNGNCWQDLFRNPVVVKGYPIKRRRATAPGLEIPLRLMAELIQAKRMNPFAGNIVLKGFSTMLVPTAHEENTISWHLLRNKTGGRISYLSGMAISQVRISIPQLESSRHVLGWCADMKFYAGAPDACYDVKGSRLPRTQGTGLLVNSSISMGQLIEGGPPFILGKKDSPVHLSRNGYIRKLKWISKKYVLLWDEADKRGWLVNGTSALLHLVCATLEQDKRDGFQGVSLFEMSKVQWAKQPYQPKSALQVLLSQSNLRLSVYPEKDDYTRFQDHVEGIFDTLEKMIDHQHGIMGDSQTLEIPRANLEGWDFNDLVSERDPIYPRVSAINTNGKSWVDFTRSIYAITLFGRGFGNIIQAINVCPQWATVPKDISYIAVCQEDLEDIMEASGDPFSNPIRLTDKTIWHTPEILYGDDTTQADLTQVLLPSSMYQELSSQCTRPYKEGKGAFIFGYNSTYRWFWGDTGDPSREAADVDSPQAGQLLKLPSQDSGIGSSLASTTFQDSGSTGNLSIHRSPNSESSASSESFPSSKDNQPPRKRPCQRSILPHISSRRYTVGIVCALHIELMAVRALFDITHPPISIPDDDPNYYALGSMSNHNVVATCLPDGEYGTNPAANVASNMRRSFPNTKFCLLVGIGGGVPSSKHDIRLGDIVVSTPSGANTGIIPYDIKKALKCGTSAMNGYLHPPPQHLRCALSEIKSDPTLSRTPPLQAYLHQIQKSTKHYHHPGHENDKLYAPDYIHQDDNKACDSCDSEQQLPRTPRKSTDPVIHYGTIASGNQVIKDAEQRDKLAKQYDIVCFEMEAAGIVNTVPSLVIRGICDYADSHKNKVWQRYAAATAAAFAKFLLSRVRTPQDSEIDS